MATKNKQTKSEIIEQSENATLVATLPAEVELKAEDLAELPTSEVSESEFIAEAAKEEVELEPEKLAQDFDYKDIVTFRNKSGHLRHGVFGKITEMGYEAIELFTI
jgi:hypothetical protein